MKHKEKLDEVKLKCKVQKINIMVGDMNTKVGEYSNSGLGTRKEREEKFKEWCKINQTIRNISFKQHPRMWMLRSP